MNNESLQVGEFIEIPAWETEGMVMNVKPSLVIAGAIEVLMQEHPDQPLSAWRTYRLLPDEFKIV